MKRYRVYYSIPAYRYVEVRAESEEQAREIADEQGDESDGADYEIDYEGDEEFGFIVEV